MPNVLIAPPIQAIIARYQEKILNLHYSPQTPIETLESRLTAAILLQNADSTLIEKAKEFIRRTSTTKEEGLSQLMNLAAQVQAWEQFEICSVYTNLAGSHVEYKIGVLKQGGRELIHLHALYNMQGNNCCYVSQTPPLIRVIGDPILHRPGRRFPDNPTKAEVAELEKQVAIAKEVLVKTSGAGIAANQCREIEDPYQFSVVGVDHNNPDHVKGVERRYPGVRFPNAMVMLNPTVVNRSEETQPFKHACLSVPSPNKCEVLSPQQMTVEYTDPTLIDRATYQRTKKVVTLSGTDAVVLWHEMRHILEGVTYVDAALDSLSKSDLRLFEASINAELVRRKNHPVIPELTVPPFHVTVAVDQGSGKLDEAALSEALPKFTTETLHGLLSRC